MENIIIELTTKSFRESTNFGLPWACPISMTLKELYPGVHVGVGGYDATIGTQRYNIEGSTDGIAFAGLTPEQVNGLIRKAKAGEEIETIKITLIPTEWKI